jgi:hypothetical protein
VGARGDLLLVGAYRRGQSWDLCRGRAAERPQAFVNIARVPLPTADPVRRRRAADRALAAPRLDEHWLGRDQNSRASMTAPADGATRNTPRRRRPDPPPPSRPTARTVDHCGLSAPQVRQPSLPSAGPASGLRHMEALPYWPAPVVTSPKGSRFEFHHPTDAAVHQSGRKPLLVQSGREPLLVLWSNMCRSRVAVCRAPVPSGRAPFPRHGAALGVVLRSLRSLGCACSSAARASIVCPCSLLRLLLCCACSSAALVPCCACSSAALAPLLRLLPSFACSRDQSMPADRQTGSCPSSAIELQPDGGPARNAPRSRWSKAGAPSRTRPAAVAVGQGVSAPNGAQVPARSGRAKA